MKEIYVLQDNKSNLILDIFKFDNPPIDKVDDKLKFVDDDFNQKYKINSVSKHPSKEYWLIKGKARKKYRKETNVFGEGFGGNYKYLFNVEENLDRIIQDKDGQTHVHSIVSRGVHKIAQKFGEEAVELVIEAGKSNDKKFLNESADVLYYYLIMLHERGFSLKDALKYLKKQKRKM